jgi:transcriptional regulator with XRE-family HTH domain
MASHDEALQGFSKRLALLIQRERGRGKKQVFARKIGVKPQQLSRYLKGQIPDTRTLLAIAEVGQVSVDWLLTGREAWAREGIELPDAAQPLLCRLARLPAPVLLALLRILEELDELGHWEPWL